MVNDKKARLPAKRAKRQKALNPWAALENIDSILDSFMVPYGTSYGYDFDTDIEMPDVDIADLGNSLEITANIPGIDKKDVKVKMSKNTITIEANKETNNETNKKNYYLKETSSLGYYRKLELPENVKADTAKTTYENGTLKVTVEKEEKSEEKDLKIE
ncbi:MAG: Hsp20/alpha crystallin family protein [Ferroplasma sp.]